METIEFLNLLQIAVCVVLGMFFGSMIVFYGMHKKVDGLENELNRCHRMLDSYTTKYDDDGYEAY